MPRYNPPPNWPPPPDGWSPPDGWQPDPAWGPAPAGWQFWVAAPGEAPLPPSAPPPPPPSGGRRAGGMSGGQVMAMVGLVAFLGFLVVAAVSSGMAGLLDFVGLFLLVVGVIAGVRGRLGWARVATRRTGWLLAVAGLVITGAGGAMGSPGAPSAASSHAVSQPAAPRRAVTSSVAPATTATPLPSTTSATVPSTPRPTATPSPRPSVTKSRSTPPSPKPARTTPKPKPSRPTPPAPARHACTRTSSGTCIQGGEFCRQALYGTSGWDAAGRRYVCEGDHTHPHWMTP
jgi:hypothetical protein